MLDFHTAIVLDSAFLFMCINIWFLYLGALMLTAYVFTIVSSFFAYNSLFSCYDIPCFFWKILIIIPSLDLTISIPILL